MGYKSICIGPDLSGSSHSTRQHRDDKSGLESVPDLSSLELHIGYEPICKFFFRLGTVPPRCTGILLEVAPREFLLGTVPLRELSYRVRPQQI